jgi:serine/threonine protein kinase
MNIKDFKVGLQIGAGAFAVVKRAVHERTRYTVALKTYEKKNLTDKEAADAVHREINTLSDLYHPHIMTLFEVID